MTSIASEGECSDVDPLGIALATLCSLICCCTLLCIIVSDDHDSLSPSLAIVDEFYFDCLFC